MAGEDVGLAAAKDFEHFSASFDGVASSGFLEADGAVLGKVDVGIGRDKIQETFHEAERLLGVTLLVVVRTLSGVIAAAGLEQDVVDGDHQVFPKEEGVIVRAESCLKGFSGGYSAAVLDEVVVADDCIERYARSGDGFLV